MTQPPEFKLPYGWIELHQCEHYPVYVKTSDLAAIEPMSSVHFHGKVYISGCSSCIPCIETTEEIMKKVTKSLPVDK